MGYREVPVFEVKEVLRLWLRAKDCERSNEKLDLALAQVPTFGLLPRKLGQ
jgi:hypothetical protein